MRITKANLRAKLTIPECHERETEQLEGFYSMCFVSKCMIWLVVRRIPVSAVLGTLMPALLQSPLWQGWRAAWKQLALYGGDKPWEKGRAQEMGWAEGLQEGCMPVFCNPANKGLAYVTKVAKSKLHSCLRVLSVMQGPLQSKKPGICWCKANLEERNSTARLHCIQVR